MSPGLAVGRIEGYHRPEVPNKISGGSIIEIQLNKVPEKIREETCV